jgi:hypothetical protein
MTVINNVVVPRCTELVQSLAEEAGKQVPWTMQAASGSRIVKVSDHQHHRIGSGNAIHFFKDDEWKCSYGTLPTTEVNKDDEIDSDVFIDLEQGECGAKGTPQHEERTGPLGKDQQEERTGPLGKDQQEERTGPLGKDQQEEGTGPLDKRPADVRAKQGLRGGCGCGPEITTIVIVACLMSACIFGLGIYVTCISPYKAP